ncbi:MAG: glycosyltransferase family 4 protein [Nitrospira sp.]|nr:glycosyltransferase family 4 protein [Nitrospira sp.]
MHIETRKPGILFIVENNNVPTDIRVWREAKTAKQAGYSVTIISPKTANFSKSYEVIDDIEIYRHSAIENKGGKINTLVEYANAFYWEVLISLRVFFRRRFHVIHGANPPDHIFLIALLFKLVGVKYIFDHHDLAPELYVHKYCGRKKMIYRLLSLMERFSCLTADAIVSTNQSYKKHVIKRYGIKSEKIFIVRNDPEVPEIQKKDNCENYGSKQVAELLYMGSINNQDGVDLLTKVVHILVEQLNQRQVHCTVVGDGDDLPRVKGLCTELGINSFFTFTGYIYDRKLIRKYIEETDICLETAPYSEVNCRSTFIKVMEYMAAGKPIVAFDLEETRYSAQDSALLIEQGNLRAFAEAIEKLVCEPLLREELGKHGQNRILRELNWNNSSTELMRTYEYVFGNGVFGFSMRGLKG